MGLREERRTSGLILKYKMGYEQWFNVTHGSVIENSWWYGRKARAKRRRELPRVQTLALVWPETHALSAGDSHRERSHRI